ncbi:telomere-associated protein RIF1 [Trichonephila clavata]|uniref:Telomere-associated protein RIF1 n=1 Tax=Trichonephila clavata TaxID=2740835 RepID=A0A8X6G3H0_TRICU|nr:telomere-associated protein RIF1 [Trichonephila clavata]
MDVSNDICQLKDASVSEKPELYKKIIKNIGEVCKKNESNVLEKDVESLCQEIVNDFNQNSLSNIVLELLEILLNVNKTIKILTDSQLKNLINGVVNFIKNSQGDDDLNICFSCLNETMIHVKLENNEIEDVLSKAAEIISKRSIPVPLYLTICNYIEKFFKEYEDKVPNFMHIVPKLVYPPLSHSSCKVREIAERTLDNFPKLVLFAENEVAANVLLKLIKEPYCKELLSLFKEKQELYVLKVWKNIVNAMGKTLHNNLPAMTPFFQVIEKGFKSVDDDVCKSAFLTWKHLISNLALDDVLNDSKKLRFVLKPFKNLSKFNECVSFAVCDTWWHLAWNLSNNLSSRFTEVLIPLLEFTLGKPAQGSHEKVVPKANQIFLVKRGCHFLLRILEQPPSNSLNKISSPKKLPSLMFVPLQTPIDIKVIVRHFKDILPLMKVVIEVFGHTKDMANHIECLLKSVLFIISAVTEDKNKESMEALITLISFIEDIILAQMCPPLICLKCVDSLSKLPRSILVSHCFNNGPRKSQDILCIILLKVLVNPFLFSTEMPNKRFLMAYNRLIQACLGESLNPLLMAHKIINIAKNITSQNIDAEILFEIWSGIASPLLEAIEKTQEVNQGDRQEHDFSCLYDVLLCPFENIFPVSMNQLRIKPAFRLWTNLYKTFVRCASLVPTTLPNEVCEHFCTRLKTYFKDDLLKEPQYFEAVCFLLQTVLESIDFSSVGSSSTSGFSNGSLLMKKKKPLGNLTSFIDLLSLLLTSFYVNYIEHEDDIYQSCTPKAQRKSHISKAAVPLDLVKTFFGNLKTGSVIACVLEELASSLSKFFVVSQKKANASIIGAKLEVLWNVVTSSIELHYLGPYDTDFLTTICLLLESSIPHPRRHIKERSRRFWFATFAPVVSSLKLPESLKTILKKSKLSLMPDENISSLEDYTCTHASDIIEDEIVTFENVPNLKESIIKPFEISKVTEPKPVKEAESKIPKESKTSIRNIDELPSSEFVKIDSPTPLSMTPRRRSVRHRKSFIPSMYTDLSQSQDTTFGGSSESFETSSSCEIMEFKSQEECDKPLLADSEEVVTINEVEKISVTEKVIDPHDMASSVEILTSVSDIDSVGKNKMNMEEINAGKSEVASENTFPVKASSTLDIVKTDQSIKSHAESPDVIIMSSSNDDVEKTEVGSDRKNAEANQDPAPEIVSTPNHTELKRSQRRLKRGNSDDSQEVVIKENVVSLDNSTMKGNLVSDYKFEKENGKSLPNSQGSQKNGIKKLKLQRESTNNNKVILKKNGKSKQSTITSHLKPVSKTEDKSEQSSQSKLSESLAKISNCNNNQTLTSDATQSSIEIADLSDSEEIIPSSQGSADSMSYVKLPALEKSPKRTIILGNFDSKNESDSPAVKDNTQQKSDKQSEENLNECPETPIDLIETSYKDSITSEVLIQTSAFMSKTTSATPLKSSENLVTSDELLSKIDNKGVKTDLSNVLLQKNDEKKVLIAENTPPLCTEVYNVQTSEPGLMQDTLKEEKIKSFAASKLTNIAMEKDEESPKTVRIKSLRSASKNTSRKSFDSSAVKKTTKKSSKRKSMPHLNLSSKVEKLVAVNEDVEVVPDSNSIMSSNESVNKQEANSQSEKELQDNVTKISIPSVITDSDSDQNSILEDITNVISDLHEKIESYNEEYLCEFSLNMNSEFEKSSDKTDLTPCKDFTTGKEEPLDKLNDGFGRKNVETTKIVSVNNSAVTENAELKSFIEKSCINQSSDNPEKFENLENVNFDAYLSCTENIKMSEEPLKDNSFSKDMLMSKTDLDDNCLKTVSVSIKSFEVDENDKLLIQTSNEVSNIKNIDSTIKNNLQPDLQFDINCHGSALNMESEKDKKETHEIITNTVIPSNNIESHKIVEVAAQYENVFNENILHAIDNEKNENASQNAVESFSCDMQHVDIKTSSRDLLNAVIEKVEQDASKEIDTNSFDNVNFMEQSDQIDNIVDNSCSDEIKEIQETCEIDDSQNFPVNSQELNSEEKNALNEEDLKNNLISNDTEISMIKENESVFSQIHDSKMGNLYTEKIDNGRNKTQEIDALESNSNVSVMQDIDLLASFPVDNINDVATAQEVVKDEHFPNQSINLSYSNLPSTSSCTKNSTSNITDKETENCSRRRKAKRPVRSPFNFRHRSNVLVSMTKNFPTNNEQITSKEVSDKNDKNTVHALPKKLPENNGKKVKKLGDQKVHKEYLKVENCHNIAQNSSNSSLDTTDVSKKAMSSTKRIKVELSYQEVTDVNTRYNASIAPQTRRLKMLASSVHKSLPVQDDVDVCGENDITCMESENSYSKSSSILKKRKAFIDPGPAKHRKVTFADPLVEERLFKSDDNLADRILKASTLSNINDSENGNSSQVVDKVTKSNAIANPSTKLIPSVDDIPSSLEYQSSDENLTDYCNFSISPLLVNCEESVCSILKDLTTPTWAHGLATLLFSKNIKTIGDLCKLNVHELRALPLKSPKVACLHNALIGHLKRTQDAISEKLNLDDWSLSTDSPENKIADVSLEGKNQSEILEGVAQELLCDDRIQKLSTKSLVALSKKCFLEVTKRLEDV